MQCLNCHMAEMEEPKDHHPAYLICPSCNAIELTYLAQDYQESIHSVPYVEHINKRGEKELDPQIIFIAGG